MTALPNVNGSILEVVIESSIKVFRNMLRQNKNDENRNVKALRRALFVLEKAHQK